MAKCYLCDWSLEGQTEYVCYEAKSDHTLVPHAVCSQCFAVLKAFGYTTAEQWDASLGRMWDWAQRFLST